MTPAEIAAGLSITMKTAIIETVQSELELGWHNRWAVTDQTVKALVKRGLAVDLDFGWFELTPLGIAVKAILEKE